MTATTLLNPEEYRLLWVYKIYDKILGFSGYIYYKRINYKDYSNQLDSAIKKAIESVYPNVQAAFDPLHIFFHSQEKNIMKPYLMGIQTDFTIQFMPITDPEWYSTCEGKTFQIIEHKFKFNLLLNPKSEIIQFVRKSAVAHYTPDREDYFIKSKQTIEL